jgi:hypothetical protein
VLGSGQGKIGSPPGSNPAREGRTSMHRPGRTEVFANSTELAGVLPVFHVEHFVTVNRRKPELLHPISSANRHPHHFSRHFSRSSSPFT